MSRSSVGPKIASASSSPVMAAGLPSDAHGQQHPHLTIPSIKNMAPRMEPLGRDKFSPDERSKSAMDALIHFPLFGMADQRKSAVKCM